jgi:hypothetical protein
MFRAMLLTQWKWTRNVVLLTTIAGFALPLWVLQSARGAETAQQFVGRMQAWAPGFAVLAALAGLLVALLAWQPDHQGRHVYALSLPIPRARYVALRLSAGLVFLVPTILAVLVGALVVSASDAIPDGLQAYPVAFTLRFALAALVAYVLFFAIASSTAQTAGIVLGVVAAVVFTQYLISTFGGRMDILGPVIDFVFTKPGILSVFSGRWMLVDV